MRLFILMIEISDQLGKNEPIGVFSTREKATEAENNPCPEESAVRRSMGLPKQYLKSRTYIKEVELDELIPEVVRRHT